MLDGGGFSSQGNAEGKSGEDSKAEVGISSKHAIKTSNLTFNLLTIGNTSSFY